MFSTNKIPCAVFGASGYAGVELARIISQHPSLNLEKLFVSEHSSDGNKLLSDLYPQHTGLLDISLTPGSSANVQALIEEFQQFNLGLVFLATPHEFSHDIANQIAGQNITVLDLSGGFRLKDKELYPKHYEFTHKYAEELDSIPYGLPEWNATSLIASNLIALPGCYPTASQLALKPILAEGLLAADCVPVINAISGVSGAGRKANLATSYCELSLKPYNLFSHRHTPEIIQELGTKVIFNPHVADFERGIIATITLQVAANTTEQQIDKAFKKYYEQAPLVRLKNSIPAIKDVSNTPFCDLYWQLDGNDLVIISAIDNLLKGASSQAIQVANIVCGFEQSLGLLPNQTLPTGDK